MTTDLLKSLADVLALADKATAGEWKIPERYIDEEFPEEGLGPYRIQATWPKFHINVGDVYAWRGDAAQEAQAAANAALIAAAVNLIRNPALIEALRDSGRVADFGEYLFGLVESCAHQSRGDRAADDAVCDRLDPIWNRLSPEQRQRTNEFCRWLNSIRKHDAAIDAACAGGEGNG